MKNVKNCLLFFCIISQALSATSPGLVDDTVPPKLTFSFRLICDMGLSDVTQAYTKLCINKYFLVKVDLVIIKSVIFFFKPVGICNLQASVKSL